MRKSAEELAAMVKAIVGEDNNSDEVIELMEDITDSVSGDDNYTKEKFDELDRTWRERYTRRFMGEVKDTTDTDTEEKETDADTQREEEISIDDLFEEKKEG